MDQVDFLKGAIIGACMGGVAALFLAPKSGKALRDDISEGYNTLNKQSHKYVNNISSQAQDLLNSFHGEQNSSNAFIVGGAAGAIIGALAGLLLAPQAGDKLRETLGDEYESIYSKAKNVIQGLGKKEKEMEAKFDEWKEVFSTVVDKLSAPHHKKGSNQYVDKILDWASLGLNLYNKVQARR